MILFLYFYRKNDPTPKVMNPYSFYLSDPWLKPYTEVVDRRIGKCLQKEKQLTGNKMLSDFALGHHFYGLHQSKDRWIFREWAPNATAIFITGVFSDWKEKEKFRMTRMKEKSALFAIKEKL